MSTYWVRVRDTSNRLTLRMSGEQLCLQVPPKMYGVKFRQMIRQWILDCFGIHCAGRSVLSTVLCQHQQITPTETSSADGLFHRLHPVSAEATYLPSISMRGPRDCCPSRDDTCELITNTKMTTWLTKCLDTQTEITASSMTYMYRSFPLFRGLYTRQWWPPTHVYITTHRRVRHAD